MALNQKKLQFGVRQGDPISPPLFTATIQEALSVKLEEKGITVDGEGLSDLRFVDNVCITKESIKNMEHHLNTVNEKG